MRTAAIIVVAMLAVACSGRRLGGADDSGSGDAGSSSNATEGVASSGPGSGTDEGPSLENCGDGRLDPGEQCDDGNDVDADGCNVDCVASGSVRWSMQLDDARCGLLTADRQGGIFAAGRSSEPNLYWVARVADPGDVIWRTPDGPHGPAPLIGLADGVLAGWENLPTESQGLVLAYDGSGMVRSETVLDEPDVEAVDFFARGRVAEGQDPVLVTNSDLTNGNERLTFWRFDADGKVADARVVAEGTNLQHGDRVAITHHGTIILAASDHLWAYMPSGQLLWDETLPDTHYLNDLDSASDGSLYAVSIYSESTEGPYVHLVERYAPDGALVRSWVHEGTSGAYQAVDAVLAVDARDDVLVAGRYFDEAAYLYSELRLAKYSAEGEPRWSQSWDMTTSTSGSAYQPRGLVIAANGDALLMFDDPAEGHERCSIVALVP